ncbi:MAG: hypothetical protein WDO24_21790 [Pseudomonadota bacterium]
MLRLLRQVPSIVEIIAVDGDGRERLHLSRTDPDLTGSLIDRADDPAVQGARAGRVWYGPVTLHQIPSPTPSWRWPAAARARASRSRSSTSN